MSHSGRPDLDRRLARIEGQVGGLRRMVQDGSYCIDILTQISAVRSALDQVAANLATDHVRHCILEEKSGKEMTQEELLEELRTTLSRLMR